jgi:hypothetical protein
MFHGENYLDRSKIDESPLNTVLLARLTLIGDEINELKISKDKDKLVAINKLKAMWAAFIIKVESFLIDFAEAKAKSAHAGVNLLVASRSSQSARLKEGIYFLSNACDEMIQTALLRHNHGLFGEIRKEARDVLNIDPHCKTYQSGVQIKLILKTLTKDFDERMQLEKTEFINTQLQAQGTSPSTIRNSR